MADKTNQPQENKSPLKPDAETLHTTDPQEHMKGPVSSFMNGVKETAEEEGRKINPEPTDDKDA